MNSVYWREGKSILILNKNHMTKPKLYNFNNYRKYLKTWYDYQKKTSRSFSYRAFSKKAGFSSPNFLKMIIDGQRNLSKSSIQKFCIGLDLNKSESDYFKNLVLLNQAKDHEEKVKFENQLMHSKNIGVIKPLKKDLFDYYNEWFHPVIKELITSPEYKGTPEWLVKKMNPKITVFQARKSIELLERLGFIKKEGKKWIQANPVVTTGAEISSSTIINYHQNMLKLAYGLLPNVSAEKRDISSLTIGLSKNHLPVLKKMVQNFRKDIIKTFGSVNTPEEVVFLNLQLLPLTNFE